MTGAAAPGSVRAYCLELLESGPLAAKLRPPLVEGTGAALGDDEPGPPLRIDRPVRADHLRMTSGKERLPGLKQLGDPAARRVCLERFAHHELQAVELFAWALLAFPDMPPALRRGALRTLAEEQAHLRLYLERLEALGGGLGEGPHSDYFWQCVPTDKTGADGVRAFLCAMGLTLEQANLDFTLMYRDAFSRAGDIDTAAVMQRVHDDEIGHVKLATTWMAKLGREGERDVDAYLASIEFPLGPARAKGRRFDIGARKKAGLSREMIELVRAARPYEEPTPRAASER